MTRLLGTKCVDGVFTDRKSGFSFAEDFAMGPAGARKDAPARPEKLKMDLVLALMTGDAYAPLPWKPFKKMLCRAARRMFSRSLARVPREFTGR